MSNSPLPISLLPNAQSNELTPNDLLVVVNYDVPSGTTKNITTDDFKTYITSGITGDYLPLSGGVMDDNAIIQFDNASQLREGVYDFGGQGGISQICGVGYENNWQSGINHIFDNNDFIRESSHCFNIIPDNTFDSSLRFKVGSRWVLDNGDIYVCSDNNINTAVWDLEINDTYVTGGTYYTGGTIIFDYNIGGTFQVTGLTEDLNNEIAGLAEADEETIELNLTTNKIQLKEIVAEATGGTRTFQGDFAISGGTLNLDTIGSGSPIINLGLDSSGEVVTGTTNQTVTITGGTNIEVVGSYPDFGVNYTGQTTFEYLSLSGGTVTGDTTFTSGLTATTISATTYQNLPVSGLTAGSNISLTNNSGNYTVAVTGITNPINSYFSAGSGTTVNWNVSGQSTNYDITLTATTTLNLSNVRNGEYGTIIVRQDGVGGRTITLGTINGSGGTHRVANGGGGSIILTSNASAIDVLTFTYNGSIMFWTVGNDYT
jgi:hypothetical protein